MQWASIECNKMQVTKVTVVTHSGVNGVIALHPVVVDFDTDLEEFYMIPGTAMQISAKQSHVTTPVQVDIIFFITTYSDYTGLPAVFPFRISLSLLVTSYY